MSINNDMLWVVNKNDRIFERTDTVLNKRIIMHPNRPIQLPRNIAMKYKDFIGLEITSTPERYFENANLNRLIIRDAGIGDLLLLEPVLRAIKEQKHRVNVLTRYPEVYDNNPHIDHAYEQKSKDHMAVDPKNFDTYEDLRSWSEICEGHEREHRTDCYNMKFNLNISDKEPRMYFSSLEKCIFKKEQDYRYVGIAMDGSHSYRRYKYGKELILKLCEDRNLIVVVLGDGWRDGKGFVSDLPKHRQLINLQGKTNRREMMNVVRQLDALVSVDTGIMHVGLAMHIPTVCLFSIITPDLRLRYYTGKYETITRTDCIGCGNFHMAYCKHETGNRGRSDYIPPCMDIPPDEIVCKVKRMLQQVIDEGYKYPRVFLCDDKPKQEEEKIIAINFNKIKTKLIMPIIVLNEEKNLPRFIELVMKHPAIEKTIAIDGGSSDQTEQILRRAGAKTFVFPYLKQYHDMQALQRNVSCSFVEDGRKIIIMDIDECFSKELSDYLYIFAESSITYGQVSRRTFNYYADINDPKKQIKNYPDWQPRLFTWNRRFKWWNSPHHQILNTPDSVKIQKDIIHFEREGKDRELLEKEWKDMQERSKKIYGI